MARDFDGTNDNLLGADLFSAFIGVDKFSWGFWVNRRRAGSDTFAAFGANSTTGRFNINTASVSGSTFKFQVGAFVFTVSNGIWEMTNFDCNFRTYVAFTYDASSSANDPIMYCNSTSVAVTETLTPSGTFVNTDYDTIKFGERMNGTADYDGQIQHSFADPTILSAADINRARWWGRPKGGINVYFPFLTDKLANEGAQAATLTATATTVNEFATPVVRPGTGMGW